MQKKIIKIIFTSTITGMLSFCSSGNVSNVTLYMFSTSHRANSLSTPRSANRLENNFPTYELYFRLAQPTNCIKIIMVSKIKKHEYTDKTTVKKTFFVIDKQIDVSDFSPKKEFVYTTLGKNYDSNWIPKRSTIICSRSNSPLNRLDSGSLYRIRFTIFERPAFSYLLNIQSNVKLTIGDSPDSLLTENPKKDN